MENIIDFIANNYAWFLTITIILLFALIGYIADTKRNKDDLLKKSENEMEELSIENININEEKSLNDIVSNSKQINSETRQVELTDDLINEEKQEANVEEN